MEGGDKTTPDDRTTLEEIDGAKLNRFFAEVVDLSSCESCGATEWFVSEKSGSNTVPVISSVQADDASKSGTDILPVITVVCMNCGYIKLFARVFVERAMERLEQK